MYAKKIKILNYGPIEDVDITFPFNGDNPKPILLVGENGSGKSILLSTIVNGLMLAQGVVYPGSGEVDRGKVYKIRDPSYIRSGNEYYGVRVDFGENLYYAELQLNRTKKDFPENPANLFEAMDRLWGYIDDEGTNSLDENLSELSNKKTIDIIFKKNCVLYFPHNRFEEPAWLNEENLKSKAQHMNLTHIQGCTDRKIINHSPLHDNQNWLFDIVYDQRAFEAVPTSMPILLQADKTTRHIDAPVFLRYTGVASTIYNTVLDVVRKTFQADEKLRLGIGRRLDRKISLMQGNKTLVPNIFQLSSGETSLLNLFLSVLRDFDISRAPLNEIEDVQGIVIVDEIDLHLHAIHQYEVLPALIKMFPRVQFIVTTHSPLFVLGMNQVFGEDGFALYRLPTGQPISPEEFSEFSSAYQYMTGTRRFSEDINQAIEKAQKPIVFMEGDTDVKYLQKAAGLLNKESILGQVEIKEGDGSGNLDKIWKGMPVKFAEVISQKVILFYDQDDRQREDGKKGNVFKRIIPKQENHPLEEGIENLFDTKTLETACAHKPAFIDICREHEKTARGKLETVPEKWEVHENEKTNLCNWLCEYGTAADFKHFQIIFDLLEDILEFPNQSPQSE